MQLCVNSDVLSKFIHGIGRLSFLKVLRLARVKHCGDCVMRLSFEVDGLAETARDHLAENLVFDAIVEVD